MKWIIILLISLNAHAYEVDDEYKYYLDLFLIDATTQNVALNLTNLKILSVQDLDPDGGFVTRAVCYSHKKIVLVNVKQWKLMSESCRKDVIYHEMGHCLLKRHHDDSTFKLDNKNVPRSIMHAKGQPCDFVVNGDENLSSTYSKYYVHELFHPL